MRYFADRLRAAQLAPPPAEFRAVAFGHRVAFWRDDGRLQAFRIVGEDEADPRNGSISYVFPVARALIGRAAGDIVVAGAPAGGKLPIHESGRAGGWRGYRAQSAAPTTLQ